MRISWLLLLFLLCLNCWSCSRSREIVSLTPTVQAQDLKSVAALSPKVDFHSQVEPLLRSKCQGCHFSGGKVYDKLPFDRPETIKTLGTKLFTRIQDENDRKLIRDFLAQ